MPSGDYAGYFLLRHIVEQLPLSAANFSSPKEFVVKNKKRRRNMGRLQRIANQIYRRDLPPFFSFTPLLFVFSQARFTQPRHFTLWSLLKGLNCRSTTRSENVECFCPAIFTCLKHQLIVHRVLTSLNRQPTSCSAYP